MLGATAGLRLLPEGKADEILHAVRTYLESSPFKLVRNGVRVIDGAWIGCGPFFSPPTAGLLQQRVFN